MADPVPGGFLPFSLPQLPSPTLRVGKKDEEAQISLENANFSLKANRKVLFDGNGQISAVGDLSFLTGATSPTEQMKIFADGRIVIGTRIDQPTDDKLEVVGKIKATDLEVTGTITANTITGPLAIQNNLTVSGNLKLGDLTVNKFSSDGKLNGNSDQAIPTEKAVKTYVDNKVKWSEIDGNLVYNVDNNNVGIGISQPSAKLEVAGNLKAASLNLQTGVEVNQFSSDIKLGDSDQAVPTQKAVKTYVDGKFPSIPTGSSQWKGKDGEPISYSGNVGIGTINPQDKLDVAGNLRILTDSNPIRFTSAWSGFPDSKPNQAEISNDTKDFKTLMIIGNKSAGGVRRVSVWDYLQINGGMDITGNLGIGTTNPGDKLDVNGWMRISGGCGLNFFRNDNAQYWRIYPQWNDPGDPDLMFHFSGKTVDPGWVSGWLEPQGGWNTHSDEKLKRDIEPFSNVLSRVMKLQPKSYYWINSGDNSRKSFGFIAQEIEKIFPDFVSEKDGLKGLRYDDFAVLAIAAIQEQQELIKKLQDEVHSLKQSLQT